MLTGRPPFEGSPHRDHRASLPFWRNQLAGLPRRLQAESASRPGVLSLKCLRKELKHRYATARNWPTTSGRYFRHEPILARPVPWWERLLKWFIRHPVPASLLGSAVLLAVVLALVGWSIYQRQQAARAEALVGSLQTADTTQVPQLLKNWPPISEVDPCQSGVGGRGVSEDSREHLHASLALLEEDHGQVEYLYSRMLKATPDEVRVIRDALKKDDHHAADAALLEGPGGASGQTRPGVCVPLVPCRLTMMIRTIRAWEPVGHVLAEALVKENPLLLGKWTEALGPVRATLVKPLIKLFYESGRPESERSLATGLLADFGSDHPEDLVNLLLDTNAPQFALLWPTLRKHPQQTSPCCTRN